MEEDQLCIQALLRGILLRVISPLSFLRWVLELLQCLEDHLGPGYLIEHDQGPGPRSVDGCDPLSQNRCCFLTLFLVARPACKVLADNGFVCGQPPSQRRRFSVEAAQ